MFITTSLLPIHAKYRASTNLTPLTHSLFIISLLATIVAIVNGQSAACSAPQPCSSGLSKFTISVTILADHWTCLNNQDESLTRDTLKQMIANVSELYRQQTCVTLKLRYIIIDCDEAHDPFSSFATISRPYALLEAVQQSFSEDYRQYSSDIKIFVTGYDTGSTDRGLAYLDAICQKDFSVMWIQAFDAWELAQNLGFLLGARPASSGVMKLPTDTSNREYFLADESRSQIFSFLDGTLQRASCCLPTATTSPLPVQPPPPPTTDFKTCADGFAGTKQLRCRKEVTLGKLRTHFGRVRIYVYQAYGLITVGASIPKVYIDAGDPFRIREIRALISSSETPFDLSGDDSWTSPFIPVQSFPGRGRLKGQVDILPEQMISRRFWSSCCFRSVTVHVLLTVVLNVDGQYDTTDQNGSFTYKIGCGNPCLSNVNGTFVPGVKDVRRCPTCI